jgi:hypothetical protein
MNYRNTSYTSVQKFFIVPPLSLNPEEQEQINYSFSCFTYSLLLLRGKKIYTLERQQAEENI